MSLLKDGKALQQKKSEDLPISCMIVMTFGMKGQTKNSFELHWVISDGYYGM